MRCRFRSDKLRKSIGAYCDPRGILALSGEVRSGFGQIRVSFRVRGDAPPAELHRLAEQAVARPAVYDVLTHGDKTRTFCVYDAPTPEAIRKAAIGNELPIDQITQVRVPNPDFFAWASRHTKRTSCSRSASSHRPPLLLLLPPPPPRAGRPTDQAHRFRFAARTFLIRRDGPPRHALMNTTTWRIATFRLAAARRGTAGAGGRAWTLAWAGYRSSGSLISHSKRAWPHLRAGSARDTTAPCRSATVGSAGRSSMMATGVPAGSMCAWPGDRCARCCA